MNTVLNLQTLPMNSNTTKSPSNSGYSIACTGNSAASYRC
jgi:hypothetical protein